MGVVCNAGQTEASQTQAAELNEKLGQLQGLNAKLEEDLLAAEHVSKAGNGHHPDGSQPGLGNSLAGDGMLLCSLNTLTLRATASTVISEAHLHTHMLHGIRLRVSKGL